MNELLASAKVPGPEIFLAALPLLFLVLFVLWGAVSTVRDWWRGRGVGPIGSTARPMNPQHEPRFDVLPHTGSHGAAAGMTLTEMRPRPEPTWLDEIRILLRSLLWLVGLVVLAVLALSLAAELGDVCYSNCSAD